ncbi:glutathione s-transferase omega 2 [Fusarium sp. NRRL 52700]|nr:glutathione s-transferase omega 2 [Fusarium sp. NRRL 52700]
MAPDTFPKFLQLPKEIQILIWEAAVRPVPGNRHVHRLYIADYRVLQPTPLKPIQGRFLRLLRTKKFEYDSVNIASGLSLAIPTDDVTGNPNDSVYLTDSSLWTFCRESRRAMERRFAKNEWWSHIKSPFHPKRTAEPGQYAGQKGAAHTASYQDTDGIVKHITIDFDNDLIHFDPRWLRHVEWWHISPSVFLSLFGEGIPHERSGYSFIGSNIAMDYDPSIVDALKQRKVHYNQIELGMTLGAFQDMITYLLDVAKVTVWYIDYSLIRAQHITRKSEEGRGQQDRNAHNSREIFRSNDFIYTEVKREDLGTSWVVSSSNDQVNGGETETAFDMLDTLDVALSLDDDDLGQFRVLACESMVGRMPQARTPWARRCAGDETCENCYSDKIVPRVPPSTIKREGSQSSSDISSSDLNLFD